MRNLTTCLMIVGLLTLIGGASGDANSDSGVSLASAPPVVVHTFPESGTDGVDPTITDIKVTYSKDMMDHSWSWSTWGKNTFPETTGKPHYEADKRTCVLPVNLKPGRTYAIWLNSGNFHGFQDSTGITAVPYLLIFQTRSAGGI